MWIFFKKLFPPAFGLLASLLGACATKTLTLTSNAKANVSLVDYDDQAGEGDLVGETPFSLDVSKIKRQYIRVWGEGVHSQYWVVKPLEDANTFIALRLQQKVDASENDAAAKTQDMNRTFRLLMRAYKALTAKDLDTSRELANQILKSNPDIAAPHILTGLSFLAEGNKTKAKSAFLKAKNLDPEDRDIEELLKMSNL